MEESIDYNKKFVELDRASFIELTLPLCYWVINNKFSNVNDLAKQLDMDVEDVYQEAQLSLMQAYNAFKPELNVSWSTFATMCIQKNIFRKLRFRRERNKFSNNFTSLDEHLLTGCDNDLIVSDSIGHEDEELQKLFEDDYKNRVFKTLSIKLNSKEQKTLDLIRTHSNVSQIQLSKMLGVQQPQGSRLIKHIVNKSREIAAIA